MGAPGSRTASCSIAGASRAPRNRSGPLSGCAVFHGLDTFATIYLNGEELGSHSNMFHEAVFDIGDLVRPASRRIPTSQGRAFSGSC